MRRRVVATVATAEADALSIGVVPRPLAQRARWWMERRENADAGPGRLALVLQGHGREALALPMLSADHSALCVGNASAHEYGCLVRFRWRKPVGVEPTRDTKYRTTGLKPAPSTGQDWLPGAIVPDRSRSVAAVAVADKGTLH